MKEFNDFYQENDMNLAMSHQPVHETGLTARAMLERQGLEIAGLVEGGCFALAQMQVDEASPATLAAAHAGKITLQQIELRIQVLLLALDEVPEVPELAPYSRPVEELADLL